MIVEKNKEYIVDIIDNGYEGEGIAKIEGFTIFIPNAIKGEKIKELCQSNSLTLTYRYANIKTLNIIRGDG